MAITIRQLEIFRALAEYKSVTEVARRFHVTQPTVSMQLKELSEHTDTSLYEIVGKQLYLTEAGRYLEHAARNVLRELEILDQTLNDLKGIQKGKLSIAVVSTAEYFVPRLIGRFCRQHESIEVSLVVLNRDGIVQRLANNMDDVYIMSRPPQELDLQVQAFMSNPLHVVVGKGHNLLGRKRLKLNQLQQQRFILRERGSGTRLACDRHFSAEQFEPDVSMELGSNEAVKRAVKEGLGVGVLSEHAIDRHELGHSLHLLPVAGFPLHANWYLVRPQGKKPGPVADVFWHFLSKGH